MGEQTHSLLATQITRKIRNVVERDGLPKGYFSSIRKFKNISSCVFTYMMAVGIFKYSITVLK